MGLIQTQSCIVIPVLFQMDHILLCSYERLFQFLFPLNKVQKLKRRQVRWKNTCCISNSEVKTVTVKLKVKELEMVQQFRALAALPKD